MQKNYIIPHTGNGDCWFKGISQAFYDEEKYHLSIRKKYINHYCLKKILTLNI